MKQFKKLFALALLCAGVSSYAQDENQPWSVSIGVNAVDTRSSAPSKSASFDKFGDFFNVKDNWNILPSVSYLNVSRYIGAGFSFGVTGSVNKISKYVEPQNADGSYTTINPGDLVFYGIDGDVKYSFKGLLKSKVVDPYLLVGGGYTFMGEANGITANGGLGLNIWFNENIGFTLQTQYVKAFGDREVNVSTTSYVQHFAGLTFQFGGKDTDGDGVQDKYDECPDVAGLKEFNGCPDTDGDGIPDHKDECPEEAGLPEFNGCPDTDGDGIPNHLDACPEEAGLPEFKGCPDTDGDGVPDNLDKCPTVAGPKENNGCPWPDTDGDGVPDHLDQCPKLAGPASNNGCPEIKVEHVEKLNAYGKTILFNTGKYTFKDETYPILDAMAKIMNEFPNAKFSIEGHTDSSGSDKINVPLSSDRANAVKEYLIQSGIESSRLTSQGFGSSQPIESNKTKKGRDINRRVEVKLVK